MSDALPLPPRPNLEQYRKLAKDLQSACKTDTPGAIRDWGARWAAQIARLQGRNVTPEVQREIDFEARKLEHHWNKWNKANERAARCALADAQYFVARGHGFASWPKFANHLEALAGSQSPVAKFEAAVDAIVGGDLATLEKLLTENPELVRARSTRDHRSTLLHYVSANGVEDFRQKTPKNTVEITKLLLKFGADVNAESDAYGGRSTTLGLTATSCHPEEAGVQLALLDVLIEHGAVIDLDDRGSAVNACLQNGRGPAAEFLANRGARLDLEGAAGVGRLDIVAGFFESDGSLRASASPEQMKDAFAWACEFGRTNVVDFLLTKGIDVEARLRHHGQTGLHWAAWGGHVGTIKLLLERGATVDVRDEAHGGTALEWAIYAWGNSPEKAGRGDYESTVAMLVQAGSKLDPEWFEDDHERQRAAGKLRANPRMAAALRGGG